MTGGVVLVVLIAIAIRYLWRADTHNGTLIARCAARHAGRPRSGALSEGYDLVHRGVALWLRGFRPHGRQHDVYVEVRAAVRVQPGLRVWLPSLWTEPSHPRLAYEIRALRCDDSALDALDGARAAWTTIARRHPVSVLGCDGRAASCIIAGDSTDDVLDAMLDAVAAVAAWDDGFTAMLESLPHATPTEDPDLEPAVSFPDGLVLGVRAGIDLQARLAMSVDQPSPAAQHLFDTAGGVLTLTATRALYEWPTVERDPARIRAAVDGLRALRAATPYR